MIIDVLLYAATRLRTEPAIEIGCPCVECRDSKSDMWANVVNNVH